LNILEPSAKLNHPVDRSPNRSSVTFSALHTPWSAEKLTDDRKNERMRAVVVVSTVVVVLVGLLLGLLWVFQRQLIYLPDNGAVPPAATVAPRARDVVLVTDDGLHLGGWLVPATAPNRGVAVLVANGNAGNRAGRAPLARALSARGLTVLLFDYRGYGGNKGSPSEQGLARDVRAAQRFLVDQAGVAPGRIIYYGESLGSAVVTELATEITPGGLVLRSPFTELAAVGRVHYPFLPVGLLLRDRYPVAEQLAGVKAPVIVVYGGADSVVPPEQSRAVAERAPGLRRLVEIDGADHNDRALLDGTALVDAIVDLSSG
jgi:fermentation-respiration switch protein FrsA (DUF1100 family)